MIFLQTSFGNLAYEKYGSGNAVHLLFHGFGQDMRVYDSFLSLRKETDTYIVFDIFYHGHSRWKSSNHSLTKEMWKEIIQQLMSKEGIEKFHLIGYSMGGKFSLTTYELFAEHIQSLLLIAPDGIKTGFWYNMATFSGIFNRVFKHIVFHPERFFKIMKVLKKVGILQKSLLKFVKSQMKTRTMRAQVYFTWVVFKPLQPSLGEIIKSLRKHQTPITLVTGKYDKMVSIVNLKRFTSKIPHIKIIELESGHNTLIDDTQSHYFKNPI